MEKLPETIVSRCQSFIFKQPTIDVLKKVVLDVSKKEEVNIEPAAAELVALLGDGSFRDTLSILQKVLTISSDGGEKGITLAEVEKVTGAPKSELVFGVVEALVQKKLDVALAHLAQARTMNIDIKVFAKLLLARFRYLLLRSSAPRQAEHIAKEFTSDEVEKLTMLGGDASSYVKSLYILLEASQQIGKTYISTLPLELAFVKIISERLEK